MAKRRQQKQQARIAREAVRREGHARLVAERSGDSRFIQRNVGPEVTTVSFPEGERRDTLFAEIEEQVNRFRIKFGREPLPEDPLFFDPDADEPRPYSLDKFKQSLTDVAHDTAEAGDLEVAAQILAMRDVGYLPTTETQHTFSLAEIDAFEVAVESHLAELKAK